MKICTEVVKQGNVFSTITLTATSEYKMSGDLNFNLKNTGFVKLNCVELKLCLHLDHVVN